MRALSRERRFTRHDPAMRIVGAREHNLKTSTCGFRSAGMVCVTGVSGSGKSTLVEDVLYNNYLRRRGEPVSDVGACDRIEGLELVGEMVHMGQELPARSLRSNPATYLKIYDDIRQLFAQSNEARRLGIQPRDFSFNVDGGRCEKCHGTGTVTIEMHFMADLEVHCDACDGRRFQSHILGDPLPGPQHQRSARLTVDEARKFFAQSPAAIAQRLEALSAVGLGYLRLGQTTSTLSGGEAQRLKLARFLLADLEPLPAAETASRWAAVFLLDEPTTGLSSADIRQLLRVLGRLVAEGNTLVVIEHQSRIHRARGLRNRSWSGRRRRRRARGGGGNAAQSRGGGTFVDRARIARAVRLAGERAARGGAFGQAACERRMRRRLGESYRGATRIGFIDVLVVAILAALLLFASWKQFPAYNRPFTPRRILTPVPASANAEEHPHSGSPLVIRLEVRSK